MDPLDELLARFTAEYLEPNSITRDRRREQLALLRRLAAKLDHPLYELTATDVREFMGAELARGAAPTYVRKHWVMLRSFSNWATDAGLMPQAARDELKSVRNPRGSGRKNRPRPYTVAEVRQFRALMAEKYPIIPEFGRGSRAMSQFMRGHVPRMRRHLWRHARRLQFEAQIALALEGGLRSVEIYRLTIPALHYDNDQLVVISAKQGPGTKVTRAIPYTSHARTCMRDWLDFRYVLKPDHESPWLQLDYVNDIDAQLAPLTHRSFRRSLNTVFGKPWEWHRFRHTAATEWLRSGVPLEKVQLYMGHASADQTRAYTQILASDIDDAFGKAEADFAKRLGLAA